MTEPLVARACRGTKAEWGYRGVAPISLVKIETRRLLMVVAVEMLFMLLLIG